MWFRKLASALDIPNSTTLPIYEDNEACLAIGSGNKWSQKLKHMDIKYFCVRSDVHDKRLELMPIASEDNTADAFTKGLKEQPFRKHRDAMGVFPPRA